MTWQERFDRLLKGMAQGEPHKAEKRGDKSAKPPPPDQSGSSDP
jgi:hypothetical protein